MVSGAVLWAEEGKSSGMSEGSVFVLWHVHERDGKGEELLIGVYATEADAKAATERLRSKG